MRTKRFLASLVAIVMILSCMSTIASAVAPDAVTSSSTAVVWGDGDYVVNSNVTFSAGLTVNGSVTLTINQGCTLTVKGIDGEDGEDGGNGGNGSTGLTINGTLTISGNGTLDIDGGEGGDSDSYYSTAGGCGINITTGGSLIVNGCTVSVAGGEGGRNWDPDEQGASGDGIYNNGTITVDGGSVIANAPAQDCGGIGDGYDGTNGSLTVNSGLFNATGYIGVSGTVTVNNGEFSASGISVAYSVGDSGTFTVADGKIFLDGNVNDFNKGNGTVAITGGIFSWDVGSYLTDEYTCTANTDNDTQDDYPYKVVAAQTAESTYLDLEESATYPDSQNIDQNYTFTQVDSTNYTDVTKVKLEWTITDITVTYASTKTWNPDTMAWEETKTVDTIADKVATFSLTNYSSIEVNASIAFAAETALADTLSSATFDKNNIVLETPVTEDTDTYQDSDFTAKTQTITATLVFSKDNFASKAAATEQTKYGTYTVTLS